MLPPTYNRLVIYRTNRFVLDTFSILQEYEMRRERKIVGRYYRLSPKKRMDLIITDYDCFQAMEDDRRYTHEEVFSNLRSRVNG